MRQTSGTKYTVGIGVLIATVLVMQTISTLIGRLTSIPISLVLIPVVLAAILYGVRGGAIVGFAFGAMTLIMGITGADAFTNMMWNLSPLGTMLVALSKGTLAGLVPALVYSLFKGKADYPATVVTAALSPIVNTGTFCALFPALFMDMLREFAGGSNVVSYLFLTMVGINFIIELSINIIFAPAIARIVKAVTRRT